MENPLAPRPPEAILDLPQPSFVPDHSLWAWVQETIIREGSELHNADHAHLADAKIGFLWANISGRIRGADIVGCAQLALPTGQPWEMGKKEQQYREWFGGTPDFLITLDAEYAAGVDELSLLALIDHELYHCSVKKDMYGDFMYDADGVPRWTMRPHDVEQFIGVVERYGGEAAGVDALVKAALQTPKIGRAKASIACGTCKLKLA